MFNRITAKLESQSEQRRVAKYDLRPLGYALVGLLFGTMLTLSALNDFLLFGWMGISSAIIFGLLTIHSIGEQQTKKYKSNNN
ncbi:MAG: hypothetical protein AAF717_03980 [Bacteroidota bacterium]